MARDDEPPFDVTAFFAKVKGGTTVSYQMDQVIFSQGDPATSVFYIQTGKVKITVLSENGKEAVVAVLGADDFLGENCLAGLTKRIATASAMTDCLVSQIAKAEIIRVLHSDPSFSGAFISHLLTKNIRAQEDLVDHLFNSSERRLARTLLLLANYGKESGAQSVLAKISQETLAEMVGTTRSRVNFFMNKFRKLGLIDYNGHIEVHSSLLNVVLHDEPRIGT
jgi:CRP/FNR family cyclic AMP-dependent transcriptional regulator